MATATPNYGLYKPDPSEFVDVETDLNGNLDIIDEALGEVAVVAAVGGAPAYGVLAYKTDAYQVIANSGSQRILFDDAPALVNGFTADLVTNRSLIVPVAGIYFVRLKVVFYNLSGVDGMTGCYITVVDAGEPAKTMCNHSNNSAGGQQIMNWDWYREFEEGDEVYVAINTSSSLSTNTRIQNNASGVFYGSFADAYTDTSSAEFSMMLVAPAA